MNKMKSNKYIWLLGFFGLFVSVKIEAMRGAYELSKRMPSVQRPVEAGSKTMLQTITAAFNRIFYPSSEMLTSQKGFEARNRVLRRLREKGLLEEYVVELKKEKPTCGPDEYPVVDMNESVSACLSRDELKLSKILDSMVSDIDPEQLITPKPSLPVLFPIDVMEGAFGVLKTYQKNLDKEKKIRDELIRQEINFYTMDRLVPMFNCAHDLAFDQNIQNVFLRKIKQDIQESNGAICTTQAFKSLNRDVQQLLLVKPVSHCLKDIIRKTYEKDRKHSLGHASWSIPTMVNSVAYSPDGMIVAVAEWDGTQSRVRVWNKHSSYDLHVQHEFIYSVAFSSDSKKIVLAAGQENNGHNVFVYNPSTKNRLTSFAGGPRVVASAVFMPSGNKIILGGTGNQYNLKIVDASIGNMIFNLIGHPNTVVSVAVSPDGTKIVSGCQGDKNNLILWDLSKVDWNNPRAADVQSVILASTMQKNVMSLAFSFDGTMFVLGSNDGKLILWDIDHKNDVLSVTPQILVFSKRPIWSVKFSYNNEEILVGFNVAEQNVELWDISDRDAITHQLFTGIPNDVLSVDFSSRASRIIIGGRARVSLFTDAPSLVVWDLLSIKEKRTLDELQQCNAEQLRLIYKLSLLKFAGKSVPTLQIDSPEHALFMTLSPDMQNLLTDLFWPKG